MICQNRSFDDIYFTFLSLQAVCTYGRENFESWGRKKRDLSSSSLTKRAVDNSADNAMSLSREIIVLDFGDEANNPYDKPGQEDRSNSGNSKLFLQLPQQHFHSDHPSQGRTSSWTLCHGQGGASRCSALR